MNYVKGTIISTLPIYIKEKFGINNFNNWLNVLPPQTKKIYQNQINTRKWYPLDELFIVPLNKMIELLINKNDLINKYIWEIGRMNADYNLSGIYNIFAKMASIDFLVKMSSVIFLSLYKEGKVEVTTYDKNKGIGIARITYFPEINYLIECYIGAMIERSIEIISGVTCKTEITSFLSKGDKCTEYIFTLKEM